MKYSIEISRTAQKQLASIVRPFSEAIRNKIFHSKMTQGHRVAKNFKGGRVGAQGWAITGLYNIKDDVLRVTVIEIDNRKNIYMKT